MGCKKDWSLSCVRHYSPSAKKIEVATFYFGRDLDELTPGWRSSIAGRMISLSKEETMPNEDQFADTRKLPSGLISMLESANLTEAALEAGFHVEMTSRNPGHDQSWTRLFMLAEGTSRGRGMFGRTRDSVQVCYVESEAGDTMEFIPLSPDPMPKAIWARVVDLPPAMLAGVISQGILCQDSEQTTLDEFSELGFEDQICQARELVLPGPDWDGCC
jgi:hypothetical protein